MCGILCICGFSSDKDTKLLEALRPLLAKRGPDSIAEHVLDDLFFLATVLWQQGSTPTTQPKYNEDYVLLFNGDIFNAPTSGDSDTAWLFREISKTQTEDDLLSIFKTARGPYSFILYKKATRKLYFARDSLGRNSLIIGHLNGTFYISSVNGIGLRNSVIELPPLGIYSLDLDHNSITLHRWIEDMLEIDYYRERIEEIKGFLEPLNYEFIIQSESLSPQWLTNHSTNHGNRNSFRFDDLFKDHLNENPETIFKYLLANSKVSETVSEFLSHLKSSIGDRVKHIPDVCTKCPRDLSSCDHPKIGILFSGGIDCTCLALLADQLIPPHLAINLYNVAFEKASKGPINWNVPDRISAHEALAELKLINGDRKWNLIEINIPRKKVDEELCNSVSHLVYPLTSVLDESLGGALWFASGGGGSVETESFDHCCRVLLIGSGADELLGGYTRHRNAFRRTGDVGEELEQDWLRLPSRNLARDDRVIGDNGVTPRSPFVEENVVGFIRSLHPMQKCFHGLAEGIGDKLLLRLSAFKLGLRNTATRRKRALQFGSRIADSRQNAKDKSKLLE